MEQEIKGIVLTGGVVVGNKKFFTAWKREMEEKWAIKIAIVDDDFAAIKGALVYSKMYQKNV